jgi:hypothetical protein
MLQLLARRKAKTSRHWTRTRVQRLAVRRRRGAVRPVRTVRTARTARTMRVAPSTSLDACVCVV